MKTPAPTASERKTAPHERLKAWHACYNLTMAVFRASLSWPDDELSSWDSISDDGGPGGEFMGEARRSAQAATVALMTGANEGTPEEFWRYTERACANLAELSSELMLAKEMASLSHRTYGELEALRDHAARLTWGLRVSLKKKVTAVNEKPGRSRKRSV